MKQKYNPDGHFDFIWNVTLICPWDCEFCCTDAVCVKKQDGKTVIFERGLKEKNEIVSDFSETLMSQKIKDDGFKVTKYDVALNDRQERGMELTYEQKLQVIDSLSELNAEIDFAGGDPLSCYENFLVIKKASEVFGVENISITSTGFSINRYGVEEISRYIGEFEFTLDEDSAKQAMNRPSGYNASNLFFAKKFSEKGVRTKAQLPIHSGNSDTSIIESIYLGLADSGVDELLLMRTFPVGRGRVFLLKQGMISRDEYLRIIEKYREMEVRYKGPKVRLQCALKYLENKQLAENPCDLMRESFGINPMGQLLLSAWATNDSGSPLVTTLFLGDWMKRVFMICYILLRLKSIMRN